MGLQSVNRFGLGVWSDLQAFAFGLWPFVSLHTLTGPAIFSHHGCNSFQPRNWPGRFVVTPFWRTYASACVRRIMMGMTQPNSSSDFAPRSSRLSDGSALVLRPIEPGDLPLVVAFHQTLSERSIRFRYFSQMPLKTRIATSRLVHVCANSASDFALVAERLDSAGNKAVIAIGRLSVLPTNPNTTPATAELAIIVADGWQHQHLGTRICQALLDHGPVLGIKRLVAYLLPDNLDMQHLLAKFGFSFQEKPNDNTLVATKLLVGPGEASKPGSIT